MSWCDGLSIKAKSPHDWFPLPMGQHSLIICWIHELIFHAKSVINIHSCYIHHSQLAIAKNIQWHIKHILLPSSVQTHSSLVPCIFTSGFLLLLMSFFFLWGVYYWGFEFKAVHLLGRRSTTWDTPPALLVFIFFQTGSHGFVWGQMAILLPLPPR
jgi:hypothetical protein